MKDEHLTTALQKALTRYGTSELPADAHVEDATRAPRRLAPGESRRRKPGWVTVSEIEAAQSPNAYPRLTRRAIKTRCKELAQEDGTAVEEVRSVALRTWVRVAAPNPSAREDVNGGTEAADTGIDPELVTDILTDIGRADVGQHELEDAGNTGVPADVRFDLGHDPADRV